MAPATLDHTQLASRLPHTGGMCLLEAVTAWDDERITCVATSHRRADHPLRSNGRLGAAAGIEYAAQAMAVHGSLLAENANAGRPAGGFLASARGVRMHRRWLDDLAADLHVHAQRIASDASAIVYSFELRAGDCLLLEGRASVALVVADGSTFGASH
ncbi:MAG: 3-hydroxylacyl-ACP dehydratase [Burkholderiales bacterium]